MPLSRPDLRGSDPDIREVQGQSNGGGVDGGSCVVPPYASLYPADITPQALQDTILLEGRCYLACLEDQAQNTVSDIPTSLENSAAA